uniref:ABM domain-containing protein n=1 Tax=Palpitomonas bilix TaxID=652834 RepID=A0A7S3D6V5_9EUKA|mmetsp:Transcript_24166/g.61171  ORF Transcript_24166/g.61171 Transcript_24166/m.61171 type:complete len:134 (+) Transcript_24166:107-508(+)|eukprot:CAMPEP_0113889290 /NCGR_PEP_ID=MMETSP0780_2-20120614/13399_1 /TAXON_ID=652834 /ORGANISM="Palpitomonas bilix" /LENGTH=133 /DNA_ID=CAMNT_0000878341 /DNA_START=46 /DNA_END=447 /DNA_ORIENTATION=- /assembly_acc=CAM_ASM_000599
MTGFEGNTAICVTVAVTPEMEAFGDEVFNKHKVFMKETHHALGCLSYNVCKCKEGENPLDPESKPTGRVVFTLHEIYATPEGVAKHWTLGKQTPFFGDFVKLLTHDGSSLLVQHGGPVSHSLFPRDMDVKVEL